MATVNIITGATGLVGSHIAEQLCQRGETVRAIVRATSDTSFLRMLPVEIVAAELHDLRRNQQALRDAATVYHCAAFVGDWGAWEHFYAGTVETTRTVVHACREAGAGRLLHISSISVFGNPPDEGQAITEHSPIGRHIWSGDHYGRSKLLAEHVIADYDDHVIVRPSWIYGRRDVNSLPRVIDALLRRRAKLIGSGNNLLNLVHASDVARGAILAAQSPLAHRQAYNLCNPGEITQRGFFDLLCDRLELPRVTRRVPAGLAWRAAGLLELVYRTAGSNKPPPFTRRAILMLSRPTSFSIAKAEHELGWRPEVQVSEGLDDALNWWRQASSQK